MEKTGSKTKGNNYNSDEFRAVRIVEALRDYYTIILEINNDTETYYDVSDSSMGDDDFGSFAIELMTAVDHDVHPDDRERFLSFFDKDYISSLHEQGVTVTKMNYRTRADDGSYKWIKVKNVLPMEKGPTGYTYYSCFRVVDQEKSFDIESKVVLSETLERSASLTDKKNRVIAKAVYELRNPLQSMIGSVESIRNDVKNTKKVLERLSNIEKGILELSRALEVLTMQAEADRDEENLIIRQLIKYIPNEAQKVEGIIESVRREKISEIPDDFAVGDSISDRGDRNVIRYDFKGRRCLIAEDNDLSGETMKAIIEMTGMSVEVVESGRKAVVSYISKPAGYYDVILLDVELPELSGYEAAHCIRISGKDDAEKIPIFAVTGRVFPEDIKKAFETGMSAHFAKPVKLPALLKKMYEFICRNDETNE